MSSPVENPYISLAEAKGQLSIDEGLTLHDDRIKFLIGAAIDWAENFTQRSLGELLELNSPADSSAVALPDPKDSPNFVAPPVAGWDSWGDGEWRSWWAANPIMGSDAKPLRRDVKAAVLMRLELLFDRNVDNWELIEQTTEQMLTPYRIGMGV